MRTNLSQVRFFTSRSKTAANLGFLAWAFTLGRVAQITGTKYELGLRRVYPGRDPQRGDPARPALPVGRRLHPARRRSFTAQYKLDVVAEYDAAPNSDRAVARYASYPGALALVVIGLLPIACPLPGHYSAPIFLIGADPW